MLSGMNNHKEKTHYFYSTHWKRLWCWEGLGAGGEGDDRGWDGWMASPTRWTWVWVNSGSWWWTGRPGVLRFMGSQRVGHNWVTELNWTDIYFCGQESLRRNGVAIIVNKRVWNGVLRCNLKNDRMISVCFQSKPFNITVIQVYATITDSEEAEVEWLYKDVQHLPKLTQKRCPFHYTGLECKSRKSRNTWSNRQI